MIHGRTPRFLCVGVVVVGVVACNGDDDTAPTTTQTIVTTTSSPARANDGVLRLGVLLPTTGPGATLFGDGMIDAVELATDQINDAGGVNGSDVELINADEGATAASAAIGMDSLLTGGVDAIIGPASSTVALSDLDAAVSAGVVTCSPTATALALDNYPDEGLFFRTVPSDSLQMVAIARVAERTGSTSIAIGYLDDSYGRGLEEALMSAVDERGLSVLAEVPFSGDDEDLADEASDLLENSPSVIAILGDAGDGTRLLASVAQTTGDADPPIIVVNDALRDAQSQQVIQGLRREVREQIKGVSPLAVTPNDRALTELYAANAYDCVNLIALASVQAGNDSPTDIAAQMAAVSTGGSQCQSFVECSEPLARGLQIDYEGPSGNTELSRSGDPSRARFEEFEFDVDGRDQSVTTFEISSD
ncbi:MAG TPA: ABC transporter substrate-binding protein [Ilumatobacteraceae bacterium]|nr:ABC transporter substrate-binding protein [Ilumatobacteraceae bacterium]